MPTPAGITRRDVSFGQLFGNESDADLSADVTVTASEPMLVWDATGDCAISDPITMNMPAADELIVPLIPTDLTGWTKAGVPVSASPNPTHVYTVTIKPKKGVQRIGPPITYRNLVVPSGAGVLDADRAAVWTGASGTVTGPLTEMAEAAVAAALAEIMDDIANAAGKVDGLHGVTGLWQGTAAEYAAITTPDPNVVYVVN